MPNKIAIWGYGREGRSSLIHLQGLYPDAEFTVIDDLPQTIEGVRTLVGEDKIAEGAFDLVCKAPGVSLYKPAVKAAKDKGTVFTSATNLWFERYPKAKKLVVTGTKGKSTTASLIHHILEFNGYKSMLAGNIGVPLIMAEPGADISVLELSSYQIADLAHAPDAAIILNLYPEHRDWHGSTEQYYSDKMRIAEISENTKIVTNEDLTRRRNVASYHEVPPDARLPEFFKGAHNRRNLGAALEALWQMGFKISDLNGALDSYKPLPHRQEVVADIDGVRWINDSISTVPEAAMAALDMHPDKTVTLILGGQDRGQDYKALAAHIKLHGKVRVLTLPDNGARIANDMDCVPCATLEEAVKKAAATPSGGVVLLSPAAPSYGHFKNFEDRGEQFRKLVSALKSA